MVKNVKLICFDLDDTLIREVHSVMLPCLINKKEYEHSLIQTKEENGDIDYISADKERAKLLKGLRQSVLAEEFVTYIRPLKNISAVVDKLHEADIKCILITVGPIQVAQLVSKLWGFDHYFGSNYEVIDGVFSGEISDYIDADGKIECLKSYCNQHRINTAECIAVGDGSTDIPVFKLCGRSVALNGNENAKKNASVSVDTDDLYDILHYLIGEEDD